MALDARNVQRRVLLARASRVKLGAGIEQLLAQRRVVGRHRGMQSRAAAARDPLAVVEGYKVEILLRLAILLGIRMCPNCPRCNRYDHHGLGGCQDRFGNNMRPGGGILGGAPALGGSTEH